VKTDEMKIVVIIIDIKDLDPLIPSVSKVTAARANASSVFQLYSFLVGCSSMISKGFGFVAFFASVVPIKFLQLISTIKRTVFKKVRTETILKIHNTLVSPPFLYGSENWTLTDVQRNEVIETSGRLHPL